MSCRKFVVPPPCPCSRRSRHCRAVPRARTHRRHPVGRRRCHRRGRACGHAACRGGAGQEDRAAQQDRRRRRHRDQLRQCSARGRLHPAVSAPRTRSSTRCWASPSSTTPSSTPSTSSAAASPSGRDQTDRSPGTRFKDLLEPTRRPTPARSRWAPPAPAACRSRSSSMLHRHQVRRHLGAVRRRRSRRHRAAGRPCRLHAGRARSPRPRHIKAGRVKALAVVDPSASDAALARACRRSPRTIRTSPSTCPGVRSTACSSSVTRPTTSRRRWSAAFKTAATNPTFAKLMEDRGNVHDEHLRRRSRRLPQEVAVGDRLGAPGRRRRQEVAGGVSASRSREPTAGPGPAGPRFVCSRRPPGEAHGSSTYAATPANSPSPVLMLLFSLFVAVAGLRHLRLRVAQLGRRRSRWSRRP